MTTEEALAAFISTETAQSAIEGIFTDLEGDAMEQRKRVLLALITSAFFDGSAHGFRQGYKRALAILRPQERLSPATEKANGYNLQY